MKLIILTNILAPYRIPLFEALKRRLEEFTVLLMAEREENRSWKIDQVPFKTVVLPGIHLKPPGADVSLHFNRKVFGKLRALNPDVVLSGGFTLANLIALLYCRFFGRTYVQWAHLTLKDGAESSFMRRMIRKVMTRWSDGSIGESSEAREAFIHYGAKPDRVSVVLMPLDVARIHDQVTSFRLSDSYSDWKSQYGSPLLLSVGQLIPRKGCLELLAIYEQVIKTRPEVSLLIVGDGPYRGEYERMVKERGWPRVHFAGYVQAQELFRYLAIADAFIFHTLYDPYGLVVVEAMAAQVPVLSSVHAVSTHDLVEEGITGFRIDPIDAEASARAINALFDMPLDQRESIVKAAFLRVKSCDVDSSAETFLDCFRRFGTPR